MSLLQCVRHTIARHDLAGSATRVVAALSGGADSVALTYLLHELHAAGELQLIGLAHFNHQLRPEADGDEAFCRRVAEALALPLRVDREDVSARARRERRSIEDAARTARHAFFERVRTELQADVVALGHTRDDQAETYALRLLRGAGLRGLASMHPRRGVVIRPLLDCRRSDLRRYLEERKVSFVRDTSNDDLRIPRNRVRAELIPFLERQFNPSIVDRLAEQAEIAREEWLWLKAAADNLMARICRREGERWVIDVQGLKQAPRALSRLVVHQVMTDAAAGATVPFAHVEESLALMDREAGRTDAPGQIVERVGTDLCFHPRPSGVIGRWRPKKLDRTASVGPVRYQLPIPGEIAVPELGRIVSVEEADGPSSMWGPALAGPEDQEINNRTAVIRRNSVTALTVRNRRAGDRFRPIGMKGTKKLQDFFVDRKVPREERDTVPLVVDAADRIVWVAGYALSEEFRVTDPAQAVIILRLKVLGGSA